MVSSILRKNFGKRYTYWYSVNQTWKRTHGLIWDFGDAGVVVTTLTLSVLDWLRVSTGNTGSSLRPFSSWESDPESTEDMVVWVEEERRME